MKSTGVNRKIDELGRIVIPKEIRRNLRIRDGENLEIFIENDTIVLKKISRIVDFKELVEQVAEQFYSCLNLSMAITDREKVINVKGEPLESIKDSILNTQLINLIDKRESLMEDSVLNISFGEGNSLSGYFSIYPIISSLDSLGLIIIYSEIPLDKSVKKISKLLAKMLSDNIDVDK